MRFTVILLLSFIVLRIAPSSLAMSAPGAYITPSGGGQSNALRFLVPPHALVTFVDGRNEVFASFIDSGSGDLITELPLPDTDDGILAVFYSDTYGLSSRVLVDFTRGSQPQLLAPTIYSRKSSTSLGLIGAVHPNAQVEVEMSSYSNEKTTFVSLADAYGEWQFSPLELTPGSYQIRARAVFGPHVSVWSQTLYIDLLTPLDQALEEFGRQTRSTIDRSIELLPGPLQTAVRTLDGRSAILSQLLLPTLLTLSTLAQSGIILQNLFYLIYQGLMAFLQLLGLVKKRLDTGVVYDAVTKKPIARAIVRLYESVSHRLVETDVTSSEGTFSFLPPEGSYYLRVSKPGYVYPSRLVIGRYDGLFANVYSGGDIEIRAVRPVVSAAVPLDPESFVENWWMKLSKAWQVWFEPLNRWLLLFGFFLAVLSYSQDASRIHAVILLMYFMATLYFFLRGRTFSRDYGVVVTDRGKPLSGIELNLIDVEFNRLVSRRVTDGMGRYQFLVPPGKYEIKMVTPGYSIVKSQKKTYQGDAVLIEGVKGQTKRIIPRIVVGFGR